MSISAIKAKRTPCHRYMLRTTPVKLRGMNVAASLVAQTVKNLRAVPETRVQYLGWENPLEKGMATRFSILAWRIPWTQEADGLQPM